MTRSGAEGACGCCFGIDQAFFAASHTPRIRLLSIAPRFAACSWFTTTFGEGRPGEGLFRPPGAVDAGTKRRGNFQHASEMLTDDDIAAISRCRARRRSRDYRSSSIPPKRRAQRHGERAMTVPLEIGVAVVDANRLKVLAARSSIDADTLSSLLGEDSAAELMPAGSRVSHLYFGSEFCEQLFPEENALQRAIEVARQ